MSGRKSKNGKNNLPLCVKTPECPPLPHTNAHICDAVLQNKATVHIQQHGWASETNSVENASNVLRIRQVQLLVRHLLVQLRWVWVQVPCMWVRLCWVPVHVPVGPRHEQMGSSKDTTDLPRQSV